MPRALIKGILFALVFALLFPILPDCSQLSLYNRVFPGRKRLPFGENPVESYNLTLSNIPAMFASHEIERPKANGEYRVIVLGDSSIWGTLLHPQETLSEQLNSLKLDLCGKSAQFYNLGYPTISIFKDLLILDYAIRYEPDAILWLITLEALPIEKQLENPLIASNPEMSARLIENYALPLTPPPSVNYIQKTLFYRRRDLSDILRLQLYGVLWAATGIDQSYPKQYPSPRNDFEENIEAFHNLVAPLSEEELAYSILQKAIAQSEVPVLLVNEPMFISNGKNSQKQYNHFYPHWAYDEYRIQMQEQALKNLWKYVDLWNILPQSEFTNSAIHLTPTGETILAQQILPHLSSLCNPQEKP